jgi:hypothetical protein
MDFVFIVILRVLRSDNFIVVEIGFSKVVVVTILPFQLRYSE